MMMTMMSWVARVAGRTSTGGDIVHHLVIMMIVVMVLMMAVKMVMMVMAMIVEIVMMLDVEKILGRICHHSDFFSG